MLRAVRLMCKLRVVGHVEHAACPVADMGQHDNRHIISDACANIIVTLHQAQLVTAPKLPDQALQHVQISGEVGSLCHMQRKYSLVLLTNQMTLSKACHDIRRHKG